MKSHKTQPPLLPQRILISLVRSDIVEEVLGDLNEKFYSTLKTESIFRARLNYWYQVIHYLRPFAIRKSKPMYLNQYAMYQSYFKIGWRNLLKNKGYSFINIGGLSMGMAVAMLIGFWIYDELSFNKYYNNYETIAQVHRRDIWEGVIEVNTSQVSGLGTLLKTEYGAHFKNVVMVRSRIEDRVLSFGDKKFTQNGYFMQPEGGEMFSLKMKYGKHDGLKSMKSILLSESLAKKLFGDRDPVNQVITMNAEWDLEVTGVYEDMPMNTVFSEASYFAPLDLYMNGWGTLNDWDNYYLNVYAQIHPTGHFEKISSIIKDATLPHLDEETVQSKPEIFLHPMSKWHLFSEFENGVGITSSKMKTVWYYGTIGIFVLLLACINFMNLSTARSEKRAREVGIRKSIGSQRVQLIYQFLGESLLVAFISFVISLLFVQLFLPGFNSVADKNISIPWTSSLFWLGCISFSILTGLLAGSYPAFYLSSFNPVKVLKGTFKAGRFASVPRRILVVVQFTVSISLVIGTLIVYQQIHFVKNRPVGYSREGLISIRANSPEYIGKYNTLRTELKNTGVVAEMGGANYPITSTLGWNGGFAWKGEKIAPHFNTIFVTHEYGTAIGLQFVEGRDFSREFASDSSGILINESALREMGIKNPVGEYVTWTPGGDDRGTYKILGVVKDMVKGSPYEETYPSVLFLSSNEQGWLYIKLKPSVNAAEAMLKVKSVWSTLIPSDPFDYKFADDEFDIKFKAEERTGQLAGIFSSLAILISCSGLFGLASFMAEQRTKEISIRKVLGASVTHLCRLMSKEFVTLVLISCFIAIPLSAFLMEKWLVQYQYRTTIDWSVFSLVSIGAVVITLITVSYQAIKTALANPVESLKAD